MLDKIMGFFSRDIAIDLGTANTLVYLKNGGIVINEPSVIALTDYHGSAIPYAFGQEAKMMLGRTPADIRVIRPLKDGVIADFKGAEEMIKYFINSAHTRKRFFSKPLIIVCVPYGSTPVERRAIQDAALSAGARDVYLIEELMAAAIGAELPITEPTGSMVIDIGGGTTEVGVISLGGIVTAKSIRVGGNTMDESIISYVRKHHNLLIGDPTAEKAKKNIGSVLVVDNNERTMSIKGRDLATGIPKEITLSENQIVESLSEATNAIISAILLVLEMSPPELSADIAERGIRLTGGGSLVSNLDKVISSATGLPVTIADEALNCVVLGMGKVLENMPQLRHVLFKQE